MKNFSETASFLWTIAELLRDTFKRSKYQDVIVPFTVLRRIDCVLEPTKGKVLATHERLLAEASDPNLLYDLQTRLAEFQFYTEADVNRFAVAKELLDWLFEQYLKRMKASGKEAE